jgi:hypothetical protein
MIAQIGTSLASIGMFALSDIQILKAADIGYQKLIISAVCGYGLWTSADIADRAAV